MSRDCPHDDRPTLSDQRLYVSNTPRKTELNDLRHQWPHARHEGRHLIQCLRARQTAPQGDKLHHVTSVRRSEHKVPGPGRLKNRRAGPCIEGPRPRRDRSGHSQRTVGDTGRLMGVEIGGIREYSTFYSITLSTIVTGGSKRYSQNGSLLAYPFQYSCASHEDASVVAARLNSDMSAVKTGLTIWHSDGAMSCGRLRYCRSSSSRDSARRWTGSRR